jgi:hypothetical protein
MKILNIKIRLAVAWLPIILAISWLAAEIPGKVTVSLPVQATVEGVALQPGTYVMVVEGFNGEKATIKIFREDSSSPLAAAPVSAFQAQTAAPRNAVKVITREGTYYLDKLLLAGEKTGFQFRL